MTTIQSSTTSTTIAVVPPEVITHIFEYLDLPHQARVATICQKWLNAAMNPITTLGHIRAVGQMTTSKPTIQTIYTSLGYSTKLVFYGANERFKLFSHGPKTETLQIVDTANKVISLDLKKPILSAFLLPEDLLATVSTEGTFAKWKIGSGGTVTCMKHIESIYSGPVFEATLISNTLYVRGLLGPEGEYKPFMDAFDLDTGNKKSRALRHTDEINLFSHITANSTSFFNTSIGSVVGLYTEDKHSLATYQFDKGMKLVTTNKAILPKPVKASYSRYEIVAANDTWVVVVNLCTDLTWLKNTGISAGTTAYTGYYSVFRAPDFNDTLNTPEVVGTSRIDFCRYKNLFPEYKPKHPISWLSKNYFAVWTGQEIKLYHLPSKMKEIASINLSLVHNPDTTSNYDCPVVHVEVGKDSIQILLQEHNKKGPTLRLVKYQLDQTKDLVEKVNSLSVSDL